MPEGGRYPNLRQWMLNPLDSAVASRFPVRLANRDCQYLAGGALLIRAATCATPAAETVTHRWRSIAMIRELIYIEILETVLMATLDPDLWKSALQKLAFLTGSALMELFNVKPAENAVAELLVRGLTLRGISIATIGTHLSALYQKTHTRHQAELLLILRVIDGEWLRFGQE